jgi:hypothetical protein
MANISFSVRERVAMGVMKLDEDDLKLYAPIPCFILKQHLHYKYYGIKVEGKREYLHRLVMNAAPDLVVDHINGDTTDNRKENLRLCTNIENTKNLRKQANGITSKYKGVSYYSRDGTWEVNVAGVYRGRYSSETLAASVYNFWAKHKFGEFAKLNIIES